MARNFRTVIESMLKVIPEKEESLREGLEHLLRKALYTAPELQNSVWAEGEQILKNHFGDDYPSSGWAKWVVDIWTSKEELNL